MAHLELPFPAVDRRPAKTAPLYRLLIDLSCAHRRGGSSRRRPSASVCASDKLRARHDLAGPGATAQHGFAVLTARRAEALDRKKSLPLPCRSRYNIGLSTYELIRRFH